MHIVESVVDKFKEEKVSPFTIISLHEPYVFSSMNLPFSHSSCGIKKLLHFWNLLFRSNCSVNSRSAHAFSPSPAGAFNFVGHFSFCFLKVLNAPRWGELVNIKPPRQGKEKSANALSPVYQICSCSY